MMPAYAKRVSQFYHIAYAAVIRLISVIRAVLRVVLSDSAGDDDIASRQHANGVLFQQSFSIGRQSLFSVY